MRPIAIVLLFALWPAIFLPAADQQDCRALMTPVPITREPIAFSEQQESDLGDAVAELIDDDLRVVRDDRNTYLQGIGDRLLKAVPPTRLRFSFELIDDGDLNAFALPGGRVFVSRKTVAFTRTEDELAGILAHEIGHIMTRQIAADLTRDFREVLNVRVFGDRQDIFQKYGLLYQKRGAGATRSEKRHGNQQVDADRFALSAAALAGYAPDAYVDVWDRYTETAGRTGNLFTDFFNTTGEGSRRLREMSRAIAKLPAACRAERPTSSTAEFATWRERVIADTTAVPAPASAMHGIGVPVDSVRPLEPPLGTELHTLRFSPDGTRALAQDDSAVYVLSRDPFKVLFRVDAFDANPAYFTPDSREIVISTPDLRVERWDPATGRRIAASELVIREGCLGSAVSAKGDLLACVDNDLTLSLIDIASGIPVWKKDKAFPTAVPLGISVFLERPIYTDSRHGWFTATFSSDDRYLVVTSHSKQLVIDVPARAELKVPDALRRALVRQFDFVGGDRIISVDRQHPDQSTMVSFPSGEVLKTLTLAGSVAVATNNQYAMLRPIKDWPLGLVDLSSGKIVMGNRTPAFDVHGHVHLGERANGEVGLYDLDSPRPSAVTALPAPTLGRIQYASVSPDLRWLALSGRDRGAVWNLETGARVVQVLAFTGASIGDDGLLYADFPARKQVKDGQASETPRTIVSLDAAGRPREQRRVEGEWTTLNGRYLSTITARQSGNPDRDVVLEVRDVRSDTPLWRREFPKETPTRHVDDGGGRLVLEWPIVADAARDGLSEDRVARKAAQAKVFREGSGYYVEVLDIASGVLIGRVLVESGTIRGVRASGDMVAVLDRRNQVTVFNARTGERLGSTFGRGGTLSHAAGLLLVPERSGRVDVYDLATVNKIATLRFATTVRLARFNPDGSRLLVVTSDQISHLLSTAALRKGAQTP